MKNLSKRVFTVGVRSMLLATFGFAVMQSLIKEVGHFHFSQLVFFRSAITALLCSIYLKYNNIPLFGKNQKLLFLRALFGVFGMTFFFITLQRMPLGASVSIKYLSPIFTAIFAVLLIKEKIKPLQWIFFLTAILGVFLLKGFDTRIDQTTFIFGIVGAISGGLVYVIIRHIGNSENSVVIVNYYMTFAAVLAGIMMTHYWISPTVFEWFLLLAIGTIGCAAQIYMTKAFQAEAINRIAPIKYMEVIYSLIIGFIWFSESYSILGFLGIFLILGSMFLNVLVKNN